MPPATGNSAVPVKPAPHITAVSIGQEELTVILNKSAVNAMENATRMSVPQSEKAALREMARERPLPDYVKLCKQLENDVINVDYEVLDIVDSNIANMEWNDMGYDLPPIANNTKAFKVKAGNYMYEPLS